MSHSAAPAASRVRLLVGVLVVAGLIAGPVVYAFHLKARTKHFHVVRPHVLYRSGQMTIDGLRSIIRDYGIRTVVSLRDSYTPGLPPPDLREEEFCHSQGVAYVRIPPRHWLSPDGGPAPVQPGVDTFVSVMREAKNRPVLIHCFAGIHRTGAYCAIYRMEFEHWSNAEALAEVRALGYSNLDEELDILTYLEQYRPSWRPAAEAPPLPPAAPKKKTAHHRKKYKPTPAG
jgi:protein tyrosine phosphatase (PTP) superfamily phosphohydrolase (DUF442 family)